MYVNGNLAALVSNEVGPGFGQPVDANIPVELTPEMIDFYNRQNTLTVPGTNIPVNVKPATDQLTNILVYLAIAGVVLYMLRRN